jgi:hypothetical protein
MTRVQGAGGRDATNDDASFRHPAPGTRPPFMEVHR